MVAGDSVRESDLTIRMPMAPKTAAARAVIAGMVRVSTPGLRMIMAPEKPTAIAAERRKPTLSAKKSAAPRVANKGVVKVSAVTSAIGIKEMAVNQVRVAATMTSEPTDVQADAQRAPAGHAEAQEPRRYEDKPEEGAEEGDFERMHIGRDVADDPRHRREAKIG
jgi:hypothetical protein